MVFVVVLFICFFFFFNLPGRQLIILVSLAKGKKVRNSKFPDLL